MKCFSLFLGLPLLLSSCDFPEKVVAAVKDKQEEQKKEDQAEKLAILHDNGERDFGKKLAAIHEKWLGTPWAFSGTTKEAQKDSIACGYFVTTTLQAEGMKLERVKLAQTASETMIKALVENNKIHRYSDASLDDFLEKTRAQGAGYYIVGLDKHTGFLKVGSEGKVLFIHAAPGRGVVLEWPKEARELAKSRYRVTGKLE